MAPQSDEANLARIRDNQRRSRARRKEYQQELEQRVRAFEELGVEASTEVQQAARRVAEENRKLRALLQNNGISHASIEAYLQTGDFSAAMATTTTTAAIANIATTTATASNTYSSALDHLMVPRFPAHYVSPLGAGGSALSVSGSVGPSSPAGGSVGGDVGGPGAGSDWEPSMARDVGVMGTTHSSTSSPPVALRTASGRASGSHRGSHRSASDHHKGKRVSTPGPTSSSSRRHMSSSAMMPTDPTAASSSATDYLTPGFDLSNAAFYGLDGTSAEDLQYTSNEAAFFDYSASPHYYGSAGGAGPSGSGSGTGGNVATMGTTSASGRLNAMPGMNQATGGATGYYGQVPNILSGGGSGACHACLSGMGCQVHGYYDE